MGVLLFAILGVSFWLAKSKDTFTDSKRDLAFKILAITYPVSNGLLAALTTLFSKITGTLITTSFAGDNQFTRPLTYMFIGIFLATAIGQVVVMNQWVQDFDATLAVPISYATWVAFAITGGAIFFNEFANFSAVQYAMYIMGVVVILGGVFTLSLRVLSGQVSTVPHGEVQHVVLSGIQRTNSTTAASGDDGTMTAIDATTAAGGELSASELSDEGEVTTLPDNVDLQHVISATTTSPTAVVPDSLSAIPPRALRSVSTWDAATLRDNVVTPVSLRSLPTNGATAARQASNIGGLTRHFRRSAVQISVPSLDDSRRRIAHPEDTRYYAPLPYFSLAALRWRENPSLTQNRTGQLRNAASSATTEVPSAATTAAPSRGMHTAPVTRITTPIVVEAVPRSLADLTAAVAKAKKANDGTASPVAALERTSARERSDSPLRPLSPTLTEANTFRTPTLPHRMFAPTPTRHVRTYSTGPGVGSPSPE
eukprot:TRINITY_DN5106_c0_g1_i1.p1 TRINITY_DN5106_c0_g1~~TRINITY_DN5106_c0_g1_i1.p1  ORF type:complete len:483 (+),score=74.69 TRINITY_DN5106_c0_g1_i1:626-2074(+)